MDRGREREIKRGIEGKKMRKREGYSEKTEKEREKKDTDRESKRKKNR